MWGLGELDDGRPSYFGNKRRGNNVFRAVAMQALLGGGVDYIYLI